MPNDPIKDSYNPPGLSTDFEYYRFSDIPVDELVWFSDNPNSKLCPEFCICEPTIEAVTKKYQELSSNFSEYQKIILECYSSQIGYKFSKFSVAQNIINAYKNKRGTQL